MEVRNILICEDESLVARDLEFTLKKMGYGVTGVASTGEEALEIACSNVPDLALVDIRLDGEMSGIEVAAKLLEVLSIPSIFLSAYSDEATIEQAKAAKPVGYLVKPFGEADLRTAIEIGFSRYKEEKK